MFILIHIDELSHANMIAHAYQYGIMMDVYQKLIYHPNRCQSLKIKILKLAIVVAVCVLNRQDLGFFT